MNYRGIRSAHIVGVLEGKGIPGNPYIIVDYVLVYRNDGVLMTVGRVQPLEDEDKIYIGSDEVPKS